MIRPETKGRARALQLLCAWALQDEPPMADVVAGVARLTGPEPMVLDRAEALAAGVIGDLPAIDRAMAAATDNWRLERIAMVERNVLRLGIHELREGVVPPRVAIDEAVRLAHWFCGTRASALVNGVLDRIAHDLGRL
ncbi:MAG: transcription antitermination factor NusB [Gemmatimonadales bacterium]|jgi:N utilization substance protein B|nr:transcription antitermination factor NusB [Gemmatimonadales bacterium]